MMHWCTTTYRSMARGPAAEPVWQIVIPELSLRHLALHHGLLALSALQLAGISTSYSDRLRFLNSALKHQHQALQGMKVDETQELTTSQCNASFALCCVLLAFSFGYSQIDSGINECEGKRCDTLDDFLIVFESMRWLVSTMMMIVDRVAVGELHPLVQPETNQVTMPDTSQLVIAALQRQNDAEATLDPNHEKEVYDQAIDHLKWLLEQLMNGGKPKDFAFCGIVLIPLRYQDLLRERESFALVILAHYAVILHQMRGTWWVGDWGLRILEEIDHCLEAQYRHLMSWPIDATGVYFLFEDRCC